MRIFQIVYREVSYWRRPMPNINCIGSDRRRIIVLWFIIDQIQANFGERAGYDFGPNETSIFKTEPGMLERRITIFLENFIKRRLRRNMHVNQMALRTVFEYFRMQMNACHISCSIYLQFLPFVWTRHLVCVHISTQPNMHR